MRRLIFVVDCSLALPHDKKVLAFLQGYRGKQTVAVGSVKDTLRRFHKQQGDYQHLASSASEQEAAPEDVQGDSEAAAVSVGSNSKAARPLLGFVTSEAPRGLVGRGARAVCDLQLLRMLRAQQKPKEPTQRVLVAYSSPLSPVLRFAEARPELAIL